MTKIKICGLKRPCDIEYVNEYMPDFIGFVFADTKRKVDDKTAYELKNMLNPKIKAVGVFVNEDIKHIAELANKKIIDIIQLHGDEDSTYIENLRKMTDKEIIKAVRVRDSECISKSEKINADYILFDTFVKANIYGGTGKTFDRKLIDKVSRNYFLAGGLNADNIEQVLEECSPYAVDISSGVETDGFKDKEKIKKIIDIVRKYNLQQDVNK